MKALQHALAQSIGITLALFRDLENSLSDDFVELVGSFEKSEGPERHFERDVHNSRGRAIEFNTAQE